MTNPKPQATLGDYFPDLESPEAPVISGIAHDRSEAQITLRQMPDRPGVAASVFEELASTGVNIDMIVQAVSSQGTADISFTLPQTQVHDALSNLRAAKDKLQFTSADVNEEVGKVSLVGIGMRTHSGITALFFKALSQNNVNVYMISTSEIRISAVVALQDLDTAVRAIHTAFQLDADKIEAVVYGGTGR